MSERGAHPACANIKSVTQKPSARIERMKVIAFVMAVSPLSAWILNAMFGGKSYIFAIESAGIVAFGTFWLLKSSEYKLSQAPSESTSRGIGGTDLPLRYPRAL